MRLLDIITPNAIASYWRENPNNNAPDASLLFFPEAKVGNTEIKFYLANKGLIAPLMISSFDAVPKLRYREGLKVQNAQMPFFREEMQLTETEKLELAKLQSKGDVFFNALLNRLYDDAGELQRATDLVPKIMRYQILNAVNGTPKVTIGATATPNQTDNVIFSQTYDPDGTYASTRFTTVSGQGRTWDNPTTAKPLDDIQTILDNLADAGVDTNTVTLLMNKTTYNMLRSCNQIKNVYVQGSNMNQLVRVNDNMVKDVVMGELGANILVENGTYKGYDGSSHKFYQDDYITIIAGGETLGKTAYGITAEELDRDAINDGNVAMVGDKYALCSKVEAGPPVKETIWASQTVIPTYENMWNTAVMKVK